MWPTKVVFNAVLAFTEDTIIAHKWENIESEVLVVPAVKTTLAHKTPKVDTSAVAHSMTGLMPSILAVLILGNAATLTNFTCPRLVILPKSN